MHDAGRPVIGWGLGAPPITGWLAEFRRSRRSAFLKQFDALIAYSRRGAAEYAAGGRCRASAFSLPPIPSSPRPTRATRSRRRSQDVPNHPLCRKAAAPQTRRLVAARLCRAHRLPAALDHCRRRPRALAAPVTGPARSIPPRNSSAPDTEPSWNPYFARADLFVLPGTGGLAVQQAMAHALPVIVARGDGTQDDLVRDGNGWQIPADDYAALVDAIRGALGRQAWAPAHGRGIVPNRIGRGQPGGHGGGVCRRLEQPEQRKCAQVARSAAQRRQTVNTNKRRQFVVLGVLLLAYALLAAAAVMLTPPEGFVAPGADPAMATPQCRSGSSPSPNAAIVFVAYGLFALASSWFAGRLQLPWIFREAAGWRSLLRVATHLWCRSRRVARHR